jgi:hypothetical protein
VVAPQFEKKRLVEDWLQPVTGGIGYHVPVGGFHTFPRHPEMHDVMYSC